MELGMGVDAPPVVTAIELVFRFLALFALGAASLFIWYSLYRRRIRPRLIWVYVASVASLTAVWRFMVILFVFYPQMREDWLVYITPVTAAFYFLSGVSLFLLAFCATRRRRGDE